MVFFRKKKRQFAGYTQRRVFVALFLFIFLATTIISLISKVNAETTPVASVDFFSQNSDFNNVDPGAWKVTKSAEWINIGKARITFDVTSRNIVDNNPKDIILVTENSYSMEGWKIDSVKYDASLFVDDILDGTDNTIALITFNERATILSDFSNDAQTLKSKINSITTRDCTSFYKALLKIEELLDSHTFEENRDTVVVFLADGSPCIDSPNEVGAYRTIKAKYPNVMINGIQYELDDEISETIVNITDHQFAANSKTLNSVLAEAIIAPTYYDNFALTDYINNEYWTISGADAISTQDGTASLTYNGETPVITWDLSDTYRFGGTAKIIIDIQLKSAYLNATDLLLPTNKGTTITSSVDTVPDENVTDNATPKLKDVYSVSYDFNSPSNCEVSGTKPETENYSIFSVVEMSNNVLTCDGYNFRGWTIATNGIERLNEDYFRMPANDVVIKAVWGKPDISKSLEGTINNRAEAVFDLGPTFNIKIRKLSGETDASIDDIDKYNEYITNIVRSETLSSTVDINNDKYVLSTDNSPVPIYGWFNNGVLYYYTDADDIYMNEDSSFMFYGLSGLININAVQAFNTSRVLNMKGLFASPNFQATNLDALSNWDVSHVTDMSGIFSIMSSNLENLDGIKNWDVSSVTNFTGAFTGGLHLINLKTFENWNVGNAQNMTNMFGGEKELISLEGVENWDVRNVTSMLSMFIDSTDLLTNVDPLLEWKTDNLEDSSFMFYSSNGLDRENGTNNYGFSNVNGLRKWKMGKVTDISGMFSGMNNLVDISALANWDTSSVTTTEALFYNDLHLADIDALAEWDVSKVENMSEMFWGAGVTNLDGASEWETDSLTDTGWMFSMAEELTDVSGASGWNMAQVTNVKSMFYGTKELKSIDTLKDWRLTAVTVSSWMFAESGIINIGDLDLRTGATDWGFNNNTDMEYMFYMAKDLKNVNAALYWNTSNVTEMNGMFSYAQKIEDISGLVNWDTSNVTTMNSMFDDTYQLTSIEPLAGWDVRKVEDMGWMFDTASKVTSVLPLANWKTYSLKLMGNMFSSMSRLQSLDGLQNWDTSNVTNMYCAFDWTSAIKNVDEISGWDVSKVTNMSNVFRGSGIENVDGLANWHPNSATTIAYLFGGAKKLTDISGIAGWFNTNETSKITTMEYAFEGTKLDNLNDLAAWKTPNLTNMRYAFANMTSLTNVDGLENWNTAKVTNVSYIFSGDTGITAADAFSKLNSWDTTKLTNTTDAFLNVPDTAIRPTWYVEP